MEQISLAIGIPAYRAEIASEQSTMWVEVGAALGARADDFLFRAIMNIDTCGIDRARNLLLGHALRMNADWLLMIDSDVWVVGDDRSTAGDALLSMVQMGAQVDATIIGAPVQRRGGEGLMVYDESPVVVLGQGAGNPRLVPRSGPLDPVVDTCDAIGTSVFAVNLRKIGETKFLFTDDLGEDLRFCRDIRKLGGTIYVDGRVRTAHRERPKPLMSRP